MSNGRGFFITVFVIFLVFTAVAGYSDDVSYRLHPDIVSRAQDIKIVGIITPEIEVYELGAGNTREFKEDWTSAARDHISKAIINVLSKKHIEVRKVAISKELEAEFEDIRSLYTAVESCILMYTYGNDPFIGKKTNFDYTLGPISTILNASGSDAILFVWAKDEISTEGRKALATVGVITGALIGIIPIPRMGQAIMTAALVDRSGSILWYDVKGGGGYDLRQWESVLELTTKLFSDLPHLGK